jgi:sec-independent protein translocase protein TatA
MPSIGLWEWVFIFLIVLVIFGPKNLPRVGQAMGKAIREFKDAARGLTKEFEEDENRREIAEKSVPRQKVSTETAPSESTTPQA